jgi:hypothetical protein
MVDTCHLKGVLRSVEKHRVFPTICIANRRLVKRQASIEFKKMKVSQLFPFMA